MLRSNQLTNIDYLHILDAVELVFGDKVTFKKIEGRITYIITDRLPDARKKLWLVYTLFNLVLYL